MFDLGPATEEMTRLIGGVTDDQLALRTPCAEWTVTDLLAHINQFAVVFTSNGRKEPVEPPSSLPDDWREEIPENLAAMVLAWREEAAWQGRVSAGGVEMDAPDNAVVAIEELTVHAWDLGTATGQVVQTPDGALDQVDRFFDLFGDAGSGRGPFGPAARVPAGASRWERTLARTGRDPRDGARG